MCSENENSSVDNCGASKSSKEHSGTKRCARSDFNQDKHSDALRTDDATEFKLCSPGSFYFTCPEWSGLEIQVFYSVPENWRRCDPIIFCMHGVQRNAEDYLRNCSHLSVQHGGQGVALICPEFSRNNFPTNWEYNLGNIVDPTSVKCEKDSEYELKPVHSWSFYSIEKIFDKFQSLSGSTANGYYLYGHSAGAQFVHRFIAMKNILDSEGRGLRVIKSFAANAGFWTFPNVDNCFPYGLGRLPYTADDLKCFLTSPLHILLGQLDVDENHEHLNQSDGAMLQGRHRLERGQTFYQAGVDAALHCGVTLGWTLEIVEGAGHSNKAMFNSVLRAVSAASPQPSCGRPAPSHPAAASAGGWHVWQDSRTPQRHAGKVRWHERRAEQADARPPPSHRRSSKDGHGSSRSALTPLATSHAGQQRKAAGLG